MPKKVIIWDSAHFFPFLLSNSLQKTADFEFYGIFSCAERQKKFFKEQNIVNFKKSWFYHEHIFPDKQITDTDFLKEIENEYNLNLWKLVINERIFNPKYNNYYKFSKNQVLSILEDECSLYDKILNEVKPDFFITVEPALHNHYLFYLMCRSKGIKVLMLNQSPIGYNCLISQVLNKIDDYEKITPKQNSRSFEELREYLNKYAKSKQLSTYMNKFLSSKSQMLKAALNYIFVSDNSSLKKNFSYYGRTKFKVLFKEFFSLLRKNYRKSFIDNNFIKSIDHIEQFVYVPLQMEPESTSLIGSPFSTDQLETIRHVLKSLPMGYQLIVKDHPTQARHGWRSISFYKEIMEMPNVHIIDPDFPASELYQKTSLVIAAAGASGFEAGFYGKSSIVFSDLGYSELPSVFKVDSMEKLPETIRIALNHKVESGFIDSYLEELEKNSFNFNLSEFVTSYHDLFYFSGFLDDTEIRLDKMKLLMNKYENTFDEISKKYLLKMNQNNP